MNCDYDAVADRSRSRESSCRPESATPSNPIPRFIQRIREEGSRYNFMTVYPVNTVNAINAKSTDRNTFLSFPICDYDSIKIVVVIGLLCAERVDRLRNSSVNRY